MINRKGFKGRVVAVTGATGDIGTAIVDRFLTDGARVIAIDKSLPSLARLQKSVQNPQDILPVNADVSDEKSVKKAFYDGRRAFGGIDILINNAGIEGKVSPIDQYPKDVFDSVLAVNVTGVFLGMKHAIPAILDRGGGSIVNLASTAGLKGAEGLSAYVASKHAVIGLTRTAAIEWGRHNIRVNCVCPGPIVGRMISSIQYDHEQGNSNDARRAREAAIPIRRYGEADEVAEVIAFLASDAARLVTGACYLADGGISAV